MGAEASSQGRHGRRGRALRRRRWTRCAPTSRRRPRSSGPVAATRSRTRPRCCAAPRCPPPGCGSVARGVRTSSPCTPASATSVGAAARPAVRPAARRRGQGDRGDRPHAVRPGRGRPHRRRRRRRRRRARGRAGRRPQPGLPGGRALRSRGPDDRRLLRPRPRRGLVLDRRGCRTYAASATAPAASGSRRTGPAARACCAACATASRDTRRRPCCWCSTPTCSPRAATPRPARLLGHGRPLEGSVEPDGRPRRSRASSSPPPRSSCRRPARSSCTCATTPRGRPPAPTTSPPSTTSSSPGSTSRPRGAAPPTSPASTTPSWSVPGAALPGLVRLPGLLGLDELSPEAIRTELGRADRGLHPARGGGARRVLHRPGPRRAARPGRRHHRLRQERVPALAGRRARRTQRPDPADVHPDRLQGRRGVRDLRAAAAHHRHRQQPRRAARRPGAERRSRPSWTTGSGCSPRPARASTTSTPTWRPTRACRCRGCCW